MNIKKGVLCILLSTLLFSSMEVALKSVSGQFNPVQMTCTRFFIGGLVLLPFALRAVRNRGKKVTGSTIRYFALLGFFNVVLSMMFYQMAVVYAKASVVAVLFSSNPVFVILFAFLLIHEQVHGNEIAALLLDIAGITVIVCGSNAAAAPAGFIFAGLSVIFFALYSVYGKKGCSEFGGVTATCGAFLCGSMELFFFVVASHIPFIAVLLRNAGLGIFADVPLSAGYAPSLLPVFLYICIGVTGGGFAFYFMALENTSPALASLVFFIKPALAPVFAYMFLHEDIGKAMICGIVLMLIGSLVSFIPAMLRQRKSTR